MKRVLNEDQTQALRAFSVEAARLLADRRCENVRLIHVAGLSQVCDYLLLADGTSERQMKSLAAEIEGLDDADGRFPVFRSNRDDSTTWVVIDFVDLVVHLFEPTSREYYDLDGLWSEGELIDWRRPDQVEAHRFSGPFESAEVEEDAFSEEEDDDFEEDFADDFEDDFEDDEETHEESR